MDSIFFPYINHWPILGYALVFFGMILEGDIFLFAAAFLAHQKFFDIGDLAFFVVTGTLMGDLFWYALGRRIGDHTNADSGISFVARWAEKIAAPLDAHLLDRPRRTIFISKFAYGFHHALLVRLGMLRFPWRKLIKLDFIASVLWIFIVGGLGYFSGAAFFASKRYLRFVEAGVLLSLVFFLAVEHFVIKKWKI